MMILAFTGCETADEMLQPSSSLDEIENYGNPVMLGEPIENAYATSVMKEALANLLGSGRVSEVPEIATTHLYVRMLPKNREEVDLIHEDSLELFSYPLLYEIEEGGNYYHDPSVPEGMPTWQYTVVPVDYEFPAVVYEVLDELYFGDDEANEGGRIDPYLWDALEYEAMRITDNIPEVDNGRLEGKRWNPKGKVRVEEWTRTYQLNQFNNLDWSNQNQGDIPVRGVKVRARWSVNIRSDYTDGNGDFYIDYRFRYDVNYSIEFERKNAKVTNDVGFSLNYNGPKRRGDWNPTFRDHNNHLEWVCSTIVNALTDFNHQCQIHDIKAPADGLLISTIKVKPKLESGRSNAIGVIRHFYPVFDPISQNDVKVFDRFSNGVTRLTNEWYSLIMHEMGHVSHYMKSPANAVLSVGMVGESWATAVEYFFTFPYYPAEVTSLYIGNEINATYEGSNDKSRTDIIDGSETSWRYSCFFIDLNDNTNQRGIHGGNQEWALDNVWGYSLHQMQDALNFRTQLDGVCSHLENNYGNASEGNLDDLLQFYQDIKDAN